MLISSKTNVGRTRTNAKRAAGRLAIVAALVVVAALGLDQMKTSGTAKLRPLSDRPFSVRIEAPHFTLNIQWKDQK